MNSNGIQLNKLFIGQGGLSEEEARAVFSQIIDVGINFKYREKFYSPLEGLSPEKVMAEPLPQDPQTLNAVLVELVSKLLPGMPNFGSPRFLGFPDAGNSVAGLAGAVIADFLNVNLINATFCSRIATEMEIAVIRWLREVVGYPVTALPNNALEVGGMMLTGGTLSNYTATLIARERAFPGTLQHGIGFDPSRVKVIVPDRIGHYTIPAALAWAGLGSNNLVRCPIARFRYDQKMLRKIIKQSHEDGDKVIMLVAYAGDSRSMTIDDLTGVHDLVREMDPSIWLHCDGCHGTSLCFHNQLREKMVGIELWDSITLDPHKVLNVPYPTSVLLLREPAHAAAIKTESDLIMRQSQSLGQATPVIGSKAFYSLRLWFLMKTMGLEGISQLIEDRCAQALKFADLLKQHGSFLLLNEVSINSVVFIYLPREVVFPLIRLQAERLSQLNERIYQQILVDGEFYLHSFVATDNLDCLGQGTDFGINALRYMGGNPLATTDVMETVINYLSELGSRHWEEIIASDSTVSVQ